MEEYEAAKLRLFTELPRQSTKAFVSALNGDDPVGRKWAQRISTPPVIYQRMDVDLPDPLGDEQPNIPKITDNHRALIFGCEVDVHVDHIEMQIRAPYSACQRTGRLRIGLGGDYTSKTA